MEGSISATGLGGGQLFVRDGRMVKSLGYNETLMYGHYTNVLSKSARQSARQRLRFRKQEHTERWGPLEQCIQAFRSCQNVWLMLVGSIGNDWIFLTSLGIVMALLSFGMDMLIERCHIVRKWMYDATAFSIPCQYMMWILFPMALVAFSTGFTHLVGPNAVGSGIPEVKTIMRGVTLKEYLTFNTLVAKVVGLSTALGSGLPIGKEGPFVHVASISATCLSRLFSKFQIGSENESHTAEVLAAATAVGVACTFAAPIGGVLFSIEVTASYFAVRNYWRGFYSAICGALMFRFLAIWFHDEVTLTALFKTNLRHDNPFVPVEIISFSVLGVICGLGGVLFVFVHKNIVLFVRRQKRLKDLLQLNRFIYPCVVTFVVLSLLFPPGLGQFMAGMLTNGGAVNELFGNTTWSTRSAETYEEEMMLTMWRGPWNNVFYTLSLFIFVRFFLSAISTTLPIPCGIFIPSFTLGAACGRLFGEILSAWFPDGFGGMQVMPGGYAIVGAAAFAGSVTHTVSTSVIVFELTGQIGHVLPCVLAVFIANVISKSLILSIYDTIVQIKKLPYLPSSIQFTDSAQLLVAENFMLTDVEMITPTTTFQEVDEMLDTSPFKSFPIVDSKETMLLLGSVHRHELERVLESVLSNESRLNFISRRKKDRNQNQMPMTTIDQPPETTVPPVVSNTPKPVPDKPVLEKKISIGRFSVVRSEIDEKANMNKNDFQIERRNDVIAEAELRPTARDVLLSEDSQTTLTIGGQHRVVRFKESFSLHDSDVDEEWLQHQLSQKIDLSNLVVDSAPFQLTDKTSLYKVHSLFSLLSLHHAFVTQQGRLVGVISVNEVRNAVEKEISSTDSSTAMSRIRIIKDCCCPHRSDQTKQQERHQLQPKTTESSSSTPS